MDTTRAKEILAENELKDSRKESDSVVLRLIQFFRRKEVTFPDLIEFTDTLHALYRAGFTVHSSLSILDDNVSHPELKKAMEEIAVAIQSGSSLADSLQKQTQIFPQYYVNSIRAAEEGGIVEVMLEQLSQYLKRKHRRAQLIKRWFMYPNLVFKMILGGMALLAVIHEMVASNLRNVMIVGILVCT